MSQNPPADDLPSDDTERGTSEAEAETPPTQELIEDLRRVAAHLGYTPSKGEYTQLGEYTVYDVWSAFGTWQEGLEAADVIGGWTTGTEAAAEDTQTDETTDETDEAWLTDIRRVANDLGHPPVATEYADHGSYAVFAISHQYGGWEAAIDAAGLETEDIPDEFPEVGRHFSDPELLDRLQAFADELGETPTQQQVNDADGMPGISTYQRRFGGWNATLREAGLTPNTAHGLSDEELLNQLQGFAAEIGETPTQQQVNDADGMPSHTMYVDRFGGWNAALREAGLTPNRERMTGLSDADLLELLEELAAEIGKRPTQKQVDDADGMPSRQTYINRFGSWNTALREAGLSTDC